MAQLQSILDGGDPGNYPTKQESRSVAPKHVLLFETIGDPGGHQSLHRSAGLVFRGGAVGCYAGSCGDPACRRWTPAG